MDFSGLDANFSPHDCALQLCYFFASAKRESIMKKITLHSEVAYFVAIILLALSVAMLTTSGYGLSMLVAPAYILSLILGIEFGIAEYIVQGILIILFCVIVKRFRISYLFSFVACLIYGAVLMAWQSIPFFNTAITPPESLDTWQRVLLFIFGDLLTFFSVALSLKSYLYPQVYDFFIKGVSERYHAKLSIVKTIFDFCCLAVGTVMTLVAFKEFRGIYWGTLATAICGGTIISLFGKLLDKIFVVKPIFKRLEPFFDLSEPVVPTKIKHDAYIREI